MLKMLCLYFLPDVLQCCSKSYSRYDEKIPDNIIRACYTFTEKTTWLRKVWPAYMMVFVYIDYVSMQNIKTVK